MTVSFETCGDCGATIMVDPQDPFNWRVVHRKWHASIASGPTRETARRVRQEVEQNMGGRFSPEDRDAVESVVAEIAEEHAEVTAEALEPEAPPPERHPQVPEDAWHKLNREQKEDVAARMDRIAARNERLADPEVTQTDRDALQSYLDGDVRLLTDDYGIELLPAEDLERADETGDTGPPPRPVSPTSGDIEPRELRRRRRYLLGKAGLPAEAERSRREELAEIDRRLGMQGARA